MRRVPQLDTFTPQQFTELADIAAHILDRPLTPTDRVRLYQALRTDETTFPPLFSDHTKLPGQQYLARLDEFPIKVQNALLACMQDDSVLAVRSRPPGAYAFDGIYPPKDGLVEDTMIVYKYPDGRRLIVRDGTFETVVSDIDIADYTVSGSWVEDDIFIDPVGFTDEFADVYGTPTVQHGPLTRGLTMEKVIHKLGQYDAATKTYRTPERIVNFFNTEEVYVFVKNSGYTGFYKKLPLLEYLRNYNEEALELIGTALPSNVWEQIIKGNQYNP